MLREVKGCRVIFSLALRGIQLVKTLERILATDNLALSLGLLGCASLLTARPGYTAGWHLGCARGTVYQEQEDGLRDILVLRGPGKRTGG